MPLKRILNIELPVHSTCVPHHVQIFKGASKGIMFVDVIHILVVPVHCLITRQVFSKA